MTLIRLRAQCKGSETQRSVGREVRLSVVASMVSDPGGDEGRGIQMVSALIRSSKTPPPRPRACFGPYVCPWAGTTLEHHDTGI